MDLSELTVRLGELIAVARGGVAGDADIGRAITSQEEGTALFSSIQLTARESISALDNGDYCPNTHGQSRSQTVALEAGVRYRVVYSTAIFEEDAHLEATLNAIAQGEEARVSDLVPSRLLIRDAREALVIAQGYPEVEHLGFHTSNPLVVDFLLRLFESVWERALPVTAPQLDGVAGLTPEQVELLRYLVLGRTDASIARSLGVSERTVQRQVQAIQHRLGARGRFQLGARVGEFLARGGADRGADRAVAAQ
ncbi:LuxR C-terminal-related transcriptional regulator [Leucobacter albus]|uniref:LuxR C-terminal-related transcriptional regulator n=1 Tax=Leucobacter albus TaxID=272210 RepID=A0ABW3TLP4_9MICO